MSSAPIRGLVIPLPAGDMDLVKLDVRLAPASRNLGATIMASVRRSRGLAEHGQQ